MADAPETTADEFDVDKALAETEAPASDRPMGSAEETAAAEPPKWDGKAWEFEWNGKKVAPDSQDKAKTWMAQGYNYSQRMGELNKSWAQRQTEAQKAISEAQAAQQKLSPYAKVDEYARANPDWWKATMTAFEQAQAGKAANPQAPDISNALKPLEEKVSRFDAFLAHQETQRVEAEKAQFDTALDTEIKSIRESNPTIDFDAVDQANGKTLETRILEHAQANGMGSFKSAFRDYLHDQLIEQAKASGREAIAKDAQANAKKGILGKTPAPTKGIKDTSTRGKSYDQLMREGLEELGLANG